MQEAIDSVLSQTYVDWELIIWDDQSTDNSALLCKKFKDDRIKYFYAPEHTPVGLARDLAIRCARGKWLAFLDQDDIWTPTKLADQNDLIHKDNSGKLGIVYGRTMQFNKYGKIKDFDRWHEFSDLPEGDIFRELIIKPSFIALSSAVLLRSAVAEIGGIPPYILFCPDYYLFVMLARHYHAACVQETCCWYRIHQSNMSLSLKIQIHSETLKIIASCSKVIDRHLFEYRKRVHNTLIGLEEIISRKAVFQGTMRILREGSLPYLLSRPFVKSLRYFRRIKRMHEI